MSLSKLIAHNLYVSTWIFKIDDEFNGRGHASFNIDHIKFISQLKKEKAEITDEVVERITEIVSRLLPKRTKIASSKLYEDWRDYINDFCKVGGVIEAAPSCLSTKIGNPSIAFFIEPDGQIKVIGSFDKFQSKEFINAGCFFPQ